LHAHFLCLSTVAYVIDNIYVNPFIRDTVATGRKSVTFPLFNLNGRRALVTGSSQGIGLALAQGLAAHGAEVILNGRDRAKIDAAAATLEAEGHKVHQALFDVTDAQAVKDGVAAIERDIGAIDILINNAGMQFRTPLEDFPSISGKNC
jgi:gluconate 5-dehydrogenase